MSKKDNVQESAPTTDNGGTAVELKRSNKVTAYWAGDGIAVGVFYRTHDKLLTVQSTDVAVITAGFALPEGTDEIPVTAQQKLEIFKNFLTSNSTVFGITYDPVDRRADQFKYPSRYDQASLLEYSKKILETSVSDVLDSVNKNVIEKLVKSGNLVDGAEAAFGVGEGEATITESYSNGGIKYATVKYPVIIDVEGKQTTINVTVELVSGQLKKPRQFNDTAVLTMTGVKTALTDAGLIPETKKESKEETADTATTTEAPAEA